MATQQYLLMDSYGDLKEYGRIIELKDFLDRECLYHVEMIISAMNKGYYKDTAWFVLPVYETDKEN